MMNKLLITTLITCAMLSACQEKEQQSVTQPPSTVKQYLPEITGRACVGGLSMIRLNFNDKSQHVPDTWVYEQVPSYGGEVFGVFRPVIC